MLYPKEDVQTRQLRLACRNCDYSELAAGTLVFVNELQSRAGETAGVTTDVGADPTLPRSNKECPRCHAQEAVFFQSQARRADTKMVSRPESGGLSAYEHRRFSLFACSAATSLRMRPQPTEGLGAWLDTCVLPAFYWRLRGESNV